MSKKQIHRINDEVRFPKVRIIGMGEPKIMSSYDAYKLAESMDKDLILINENQDPPIVRIEDYKKFLYELEKQEKERKKNTQKQELKEIQLSCEIGDNDIKTKAKKTQEFLERGDKVKCILLLKGRQNQMSDRGEFVMLRFVDMLSEFGVSEAMPKLEGSKWVMIIKPLKK
jgi:translation initiation factor IF-3